MVEELFKPIKRKINRPSLKTLLGKKELVGVEIGVYRGLNAENILTGLDIKKLYLIDPYLEEDGMLSGTTTSGSMTLQIRYEAHKRLDRFKDKIVWIEKKSEYAVEDIGDGELDFAYLDGDHSYNVIKRDIELYFQKVKIGGLVAGHDYDQPDSNNGVIRAVEETLGNKGYEIFSGISLDDPNSMDWWIAKKTEEV